MPESGESRFLLTHEGELTPVRTGALFDAMRKLAAEGVVPKSAVRSLIELVQNVRLHGGGSGSVRVTAGHGYIEIETVNRTAAAEAEKVLRLVREANELGDAVAETIRRRRFEKLPEGARGAGLGLLEIRRHCTSELQAETSDAGNGDSFLVLRARLEHKGTP